MDIAPCSYDVAANNLERRLVQVYYCRKIPKCRTSKTKAKKKSEIETNLQDIIERKKTEKQALLKLLSFVEKEIKGKKLN